MPPHIRSGSALRPLWVEGKDDSAVVQSLFRHHALPGAFKVFDKDGITEILATFNLELRDPDVERFGLVIDANGDAAARWQSIRDRLAEEGYHDLPQQPALTGVVVPRAKNRPRFGVWIMPDNGSPGALEDFAAALVPESDPLWSRAADAVAVIPDEERRFPPGRRSKAHVHTWLAWQEYPGSPMGQAIGKGDLDAGAPAATRFVDWVRRLMLDDELDG